MFKKIHHIAYLVRDLDKAAVLYENAFGVKVYGRQAFPPRGIEVAFFNVGDVLFELIMPVEKGTRAYNYLEEHGEGFFHIAFEVDSIEKHLKMARAAGAEPMHDEPIPGVDWDVAWLKREGVFGVFSQFVKTKEE
ncbi:MAG: hypothetical protein VR72_19485 [Clostridiaceae bacterium BRH_c20a]|nr:MAG: hypothetical protein VR72_19485 [Clostridiaceae bacterium BRH_c20a]